MNTLECAAIELIEFKIFVICLYRPPNNTCNMYNFFNHFIAILDNISGSSKKIIICGDFNIDMLDKTKITYELEYLLLNYNLKVEIKQATRLASSKCIDKIFHNIRGCK
jgi:exonuclease III